LYSAGGITVESEFKPIFEESPSSHSRFSLKIFNLVGGHSGVDIHKNRANSIKLMARVLNSILKVDNQIIKLISLTAGTVDNAIPREATASFSMDPKNEKIVQGVARKIMNDIQLEFKTADPNIAYSITKSESSRILSMTKKDERTIISVLQVHPHGVIAMEPDIPNTVQTSANLAYLKTVKDTFIIGSSIRSSIESSIDNVVITIQNLIQFTNGKVVTSARYPGWKPNVQSRLLENSKKAFQDVFKENPLLTSLHAGLEPGASKSFLFLIIFS
jgi:dipeptidase D